MQNCTAWFEKYTWCNLRHNIDVIEVLVNTMHFCRSGILGFERILK